MGPVLENIRHRLPGLISDPSRVPEQALPFLAFRGEAVVLEDSGFCDGPVRVRGLDVSGRLCVETGQGIFFIRNGRIIPRVV
nr:hypothetical protein [Desulfobacula sp.]